MTDHRLKCHVEFFQATKAGRKRAEVRLNDRDYRRGDRLFLLEWDADDGKFTGDELGPLDVLHVLATAHLAPGYVMLSHSDPPGIKDGGGPRAD